MKMTMEALWKKYNDAQANEAKRAEEIREAEAAISALKEEREAAAQAGDLDLFDRKDDEIKKAERRLYVLVKSAGNGKVTPEDTQSYWTEYAASFSKDQEKRIAEYQRLKKEACKKYEEILERQNDALHVREDLGIMINIFDGSRDGYEKLDQAFPVKCVDPKVSGIWSNLDNLPELEYFTMSGEWEKGKASDTVNNIVRLSRSVNRPDFGHR